MKDKVDNFYVQVEDDLNGSITGVGEMTTYSSTTTSACSISYDGDLEVLAEEEKINRFNRLVNDFLLCDKQTLAELLALKIINSEIDEQKIISIPDNPYYPPYNPYTPQPLNPFYPYTTCENNPNKGSGIK